MKSIIKLVLVFFFSLLIMSRVRAQKSEIILDSADSKAVIFSKSIAWIASTWKSANNVIQDKDETQGTIIIHAALNSVPKSLGMPATGLTLVQITIKVRDGKAKIEFEPTTFKYQNGAIIISNDSDGGYKGKWRDSCYKEEDDLIISYTQALNKPADNF